MKEPDIIHRERFLVMGPVARRKSGTERPEMFTSIWNEFERHHEKIRLYSVDSKYYGVSFGVAQDGSFGYLAGMAVVIGEWLPSLSPAFGRHNPRRWTGYRRHGAGGGRRSEAAGVREDIPRYLRSPGRT